MQTQNTAKGKTALDSMNTRVTAAMSKKLVTIRPDASLAAAMELLVSREVGHLPVVDGDGKLVGLLSKTDLIRNAHLNGDTEEVDNVRLAARRGVTYAAPGFHEDTDGQRSVADIMSTKLQTVTDKATLAEAASVMSRNRIHGVPVVDSAGLLVGFCSTFDVVDWVAGG